MSENDPVGQAGKLVNAFGKIIDIAGENDDAAEAGKGLARIARNAVHTIEVALIPLAAVSFGYSKAKNYFETRFTQDLAEKLDEIPDACIVEPSPSVVAPALQGLGFNTDEPSLKEMYLNLIACAMDGREPQKAHPAFSEIIRQLSPEEAAFLQTDFIRNNPISIASLGITEEGTTGFRIVARHICGVLRNGEPVDEKTFAMMADNLERLGLFELTYNLHLSGDSHYEWVKEHPSYLELEKTLQANESIRVEKGLMRPTAFASEFFDSVLS